MARCFSLDDNVADIFFTFIKYLLNSMTIKMYIQQLMLLFFLFFSLIVYIPKLLIEILIVIINVFVSLVKVEWIITFTMFCFVCCLCINNFMLIDFSVLINLWIQLHVSDLLLVFFIYDFCKK